MYMLIQPGHAAGVAHLLPVYEEKHEINLWLAACVEKSCSKQLRPLSIKLTGDALACEHYHGEGFCLNMSEPPTAGKIIQGG